MMPPPPVTTRPDCWEAIVKPRDNKNDGLESCGRERDIYALCLVTEDETAARVIGRDIARRRFSTRSVGTSPYSAVHDAFHEINVNDSSLYDTLLQHHYNNHSLILLGKAKDVSVSSGGMLDILRFAQRTRDLAVPMFYGSFDDLKSLQSIDFNKNTRIVWEQCEVEPFSIEQVQTQILRNAYVDGFLLSQEAEDILLEKIKNLHLNFTQVDAIWRELRNSQDKRVSSLLKNKKNCEKYIFNVLTLDVVEALKKFSKNQETDPLEDLESMIGLAEVKTKVKDIEKSIETKIRLQRLRKDVKMPRLYMLFLGNPGTGKTVVSGIFRRILQKLGFVKTKKYREIGAMDIKNERDLESIFKEYKDGIIFIDEFHRMAEGDRPKALQWMVPQLTSPEYARTVVIGAGYETETIKMIRNEDIDPGLDGRFENRIVFHDYTREELGQILQLKTSKVELELEPNVFDEALTTITRRQRAMVNPSNARAVEKFLESARLKQESRLADIESSLNDEEFERESSRLTLEDVQEASRCNLDEFWAMFDEKFGHLDDLRRELKKIESKVMRLKDRKKDVCENFNWKLIGKSGTGKSTLAKEVFGKFFCALDIIPYPDVITIGGTDLQAQYVGQTTPKVHEKFKEAWGKVIFIDEVSGFLESGFLNDIDRKSSTLIENFNSLSLTWWGSLEKP